MKYLLFLRSLPIINISMSANTKVISNIFSSFLTLLVFTSLFLGLIWIFTPSAFVYALDESSNININTPITNPTPTPSIFPSISVPLTPPQNADKEVKIEKELFFSPDKTDLNGETRQEIYHLKEYILKTSGFTLDEITLVAYLPKNGSPQANNVLALKRAAYIKWFLEYQKISPKYISIKTLPYTDFTYNCDLRKKVCQDRENRVHITIIGKIKATEKP